MFKDQDHLWVQFLIVYKLSFLSYIENENETTDWFILLYLSNKQITIRVASIFLFASKQHLAAGSNSTL